MRIRYGKTVCIRRMENGWMAGKLEGKELLAMTGQ